MKNLARILSLLVLTLAMCLVPLSSAAGDGEGAGGNGSGGSGSGGGGDAPPVSGVSVPRVMVEDFSVNPGRVFAGQAFTVDFALRNTSTATRVQNLKVTLASPDTAFLPTGGSSSIFIPRISAGRSSSQSMSFRALPALEAKPYPLTITVEYEDGNANPFSATETLAIEVNQELRVDSSLPTIVPQGLMIGQQGSMTFAIQNQGKAKLFNARVTVAEGQSIAAVDHFVGTIEPGASGAVDLTVTANEVSTTPVELVITYEDVNGEQFRLSRQVDVPVMEEVPPVEPGIPEEPMPEEMGFPWFAVIAGTVLLCGLAAVVIMMAASRRRRAALEDEASLAAMSGDPLITDDWQ